jgi:hypothetical protein
LLRPRLCAPYRAQTNGKVERFIRYLRQSFYVPFASRLAQEGLIVDRETANLAAGRWLREVAIRVCTAPPARSRPNGWPVSGCSCSRSRCPMAAAACARSRAGTPEWTQE